MRKDNFYELATCNSSSIVVRRGFRYVAVRCVKMATATFKVIGTAELRRKFKDLSNKLQLKIVRAALDKAAVPVLAAMQNKVRVKTGRLKAGIRKFHLRLKGPRDRAAIMIAPPRREELGLPAHKQKGDQGYYPAYLEYGTPTAPAYPFIRPAFDETKALAEEIIKAETARGIVKEWSKGQEALRKAGLP